MQKVIDTFTATTGWTGSVAGVTAYGTNSIKEYIAGLNSTSVVFHFSAGSQNQYITKTISSALTGYDEIVFHIWSRNKGYMGVDYKHASDFAYSIDFGTGTTYYIPTFNMFHYVSLYVYGITTATRIRITALHNDDDYIIMSNMIAVKDELPLDIFTGIQSQLNYDMGLFYPRITSGVQNKGILLSTFSGTAADTSIVFSDSLKLAEKYAVIYLDDGVHTETHQIDHNDEREYFFNTRYSGKSLVNTFSSANAYLIIPCEYGLSETEILLPGMNINGMSPEEIYRSSKLDVADDTMVGSESILERLTPTTFVYIITVDLESRHNSLIAAMSEVVRTAVAREYFWCNGRKVNMRQNSPAAYVEVTEGYNQIPKMQYLITVEVREETSIRETLVKSNDDVISYTIEAQQ